MLVILAIVLIQAAPAQDESIVDNIAQDEGAFVISPKDNQNTFLKLLKLKKLLLLG